MRDFKDKIAVVTGAGTGMGRELARQLASEGCHVAICEFIVENMNETKDLCEAESLPGTKVLACECDVSDEDQVIAFREMVKGEFGTKHINLLFNNAGVGGGESFVLADRKIWDRVFAIDWFGVYYNTRAFMPMLMESTEGHIINTSSVNGFWACLGPDSTHTAYSSAKFAVKGFTEALQVDLRLNAPHIKASLVMPGHIGTSIAIHGPRILGLPTIDELPASEIASARKQWEEAGLLTGEISDGQFREMLKRPGEDFRDNAPVSSAEGAQIILEGVRNGQWRILVGEDAKALDQMARNHPEELYDPEFYARLSESDEYGGLFALPQMKDDIWSAAGEGDISAIKRHLSAGTDLNTIDPALGITPLNWSATFGRTEAAGMLIEGGADVNAKSRDGSTPLHTSAFYGWTEIVKLLLEKGADASIRSQNRQTPLEAVTQPWSPELEGIYRYIGGLLKTEFDLEKIKAARPIIADLLRQHEG